MAEKSLFFDAPTFGDGVSQYTATELFDWVRRSFGEGILRGYANELACSGTATPVAVATGAANVYGSPYENTSIVNVTIPTPLIGTTGHRIVLRKIWAAQTVRIVLLSSNDGVSAIPAATQTPGVTYDITLCTLTITTGGVITLTDARVFAQYQSNHVKRNGDTMTGDFTVSTAVSSARLGLEADNFPTQHYIRRNAPANNRRWEWVIGSDTSFFGRVVNDALSSFVNWIEVVRNGTTVSSVNFPSGGDTVKSGGNTILHTGNMALRVVTAWIADLAVTGEKLASGAAAANLDIRRRGGSATNWNTAGTTNYAPSSWRVQCGATSFTFNSGSSSGNVDITLPVAYANQYLVFVTPSSLGSSAEWFSGNPNSVSEFRIAGQRATTSGTATFTIHWMTIGPI